MTDEEFRERMATSLGSIDAKLTQVLNNNQKTMLALIGVIAANIGMKLVGSTVTADLMAFASMFAGAFLVGGTVFTWKKTPLLRTAVRLIFATFLFFSTLMRAFMFQSGTTLPPMWYSPIIDGFFIVLSIFLVLSIWKDENLNGEKIKDNVVVRS